jgi:CO/xanthine dehydrogenase Mo-binding subunit
VDSSSPPFRVIGHRTPKVDAIDKVIGRAQFGADIALPRLSVGKVLRSPHAHARIRCIETTKAAAKPHVAAYRAPGATPTNFALESVIDEVGEALHMDPLAFRLKNMSRASDPMPDGVQLPSVSMREMPMTPERLYWAMKDDARRSLP